MKEIGTINIRQREPGSDRSNKRLRKNGLIPGNIYAKDMDSVSITLRADDLKKTMSKYGRNSGYKLLQPDGNMYTVIIKNIQILPMNNEYIHAEFQKISLTDKITVDVPIFLTGRELLDSRDIFSVKHIENLSVSGIPQNIPDYIEIDVTDKEIGDFISMADVTLPEGLETDTEPDFKLVSFTRGKVYELEETTEETDEETDAEDQTDDENTDEESDDTENK
ncbi:MAG: 50S ribosomal protein L25 [Eubacteriales bacterium]|nr:50S ribosomal protein L25 [Eubacteriales bacterium]